MGHPRGASSERWLLARLAIRSALWSMEAVRQGEVEASDRREGDRTMDEKVTVGRIVHYVLKGGRLGSGEHRAAMVMAVWRSGTPNLRVFLDGGNDGAMPDGVLWEPYVQQDEETKAPGTWHWPERDQ